MKISDGTYTEFDSGHFSFMMHTGNNYVTPTREGGQIYSTYQTAYIESKNPFDFFSFDFLWNKNRTN